MGLYVCDTSELPEGERKFVKVNDTEIAVVNVDGEIYAVRNFCPHMAGPLAKGRIEEDEHGKTIHCPFHSWGFYLEDGEAAYPRRNREQVRVYPVNVEGDGIYLDIESGDNSGSSSLGTEVG